jgi:hypothetical protein
MEHITVKGFWGTGMYSEDQFAALELMCRERAALAQKEMEYVLAEYWLAEAEEWKEFRESAAPFMERTANRSSDLAKTNNIKVK